MCTPYPPKFPFLVREEEGLNKTKPEEADVNWKSIYVEKINNFFFCNPTASQTKTVVLQLHFGLTLVQS